MKTKKVYTNPGFFEVVGKPSTSLAEDVGLYNPAADFVYVRLHGPGNKYQGSYSEEQLKQWAEQCKEWQRQGLDVFVFFDNDEKGYAAFNARILKELVLKYG